MPARYWRPDGLDGLDLLRAESSDHRYARHSHEGYALGVVDAGSHAFVSRGRRWTAIPGRVVVVNPDDAHDGGPAASDGEYSYRMLYVDAAWFTASLREVTGRPAAFPFFPDAVVTDAPLAGQLRRLHRLLERPESRLERESMLTAALIALARRHGTGAPREGLTVAGSGAVTLARDFLVAHFAEDVSLAALAALAGVDRFQLLRAFRRSVGLPPHLFQTQLRLRHARRRLLAGDPPARVAAASGFADQSHLIRKFKAAYGATPGQFLGARKNVQSREGSDRR